MALNIKDSETEQLVAKLAASTGQNKTAAIRDAVGEKLARVQAHGDAEERGRRFRQFLEEEIWPQVSPENRGKVITKQEREEILGYGAGGV